MLVPFFYIIIYIYGGVILEKNYYLIPLIKEKNIYYNGISLVEYIKKTFPLLYELEEERISILYSSDVNLPMPNEFEELYHSQQELTKEIYNFLDLPQRLIVVGNNSQVKEIKTRNILVSKYEVAFSIRKKKYTEILPVLKNDYIKKVHNFFYPDEALLRYANYSKKEFLSLIKDENVIDYQLLRSTIQYQKAKTLVKEWRNKK